MRVNDLQLARKDHLFYLTGVDVGGMGLVRRLGLDSLVKGTAKLFNKKPKNNVIPWEDVASIEHDDPLRLKVSQDRLVQMEPADIASILDDLDHHTSKALLQGFTDEQLADTLEESSSEDEDENAYDVKNLMNKFKNIQASCRGITDTDNAHCATSQACGG